MGRYPYRVTETPRRRLLAGLLDLALVLGWLVVLAAAALGLLSVGVLAAVPPLALQVVVLAVVVLPSTVALTITEAGRYEATPGKLKHGLRVRTITGDRIGWGRSLVRNLLKFGLPWTLGQLAVVTLVGAGTEAWLGLAISVVVPVAYLAGVFRGEGRTAYDLLAGTTVISTAPGRRFAE